MQKVLQFLQTQKGISLLGLGIVAFLYFASSPPAALEQEQERGDELAATDSHAQVSNARYDDDIFSPLSNVNRFLDEEYETFRDEKLLRKTRGQKAAPLFAQSSFSEDVSGFKKFSISGTSHSDSAYAEVTWEELGAAAYFIPLQNSYDQALTLAHEVQRLERTESSKALLDFSATLKEILEANPDTQHPASLLETLAVNNKSVTQALIKERASTAEKDIWKSCSLHQVLRELRGGYVKESEEEAILKESGISFSLTKVILFKQGDHRGKLNPQAPLLVHVAGSLRHPEFREAQFHYNDKFSGRLGIRNHPSDPAAKLFHIGQHAAIGKFTFTSLGKDGSFLSKEYNFQRASSLNSWSYDKRHNRYVLKIKQEKVDALFLQGSKVGNKNDPEKSKT